MSRNADDGVPHTGFGLPSDGPPRKITPVAVAGPVGAAFAVYEKNWQCPDCQAENYATRSRCLRCRAPKPKEGGGYVWDPALTAEVAGEGVKWREALDPVSRHIYYYNSETGETSWDRPAEMGPAPYATGWFGRGSAGASSTKYEEANSTYLKRPARKQVAAIDPTKVQRLEGANEYNIWYHKYLGDHSSGRGREPAETRCVVANDAGYTKADMNQTQRSFFCVHFARGACALGAECRYYHRVPTAEDDAALDMLHDVFGRERHASHREDMGGVGSFASNSRTLYVGGLIKKPGQDLREIVQRHFEEWGEVENVNVVHRLAIAFVRYRYRANSELAKVAMENQPLDNNEIVNVRWAYDDPNPVAKESIQRANEDAVVAVMESQGVSTTDAGFHYPADYAMPAVKRQRVEDGEERADASAYPDTSAQYAAPPGPRPAEIGPAPAPAGAAPSVPSEGGGTAVAGDGADAAPTAEDESAARAEAEQRRLDSLLSAIDASHDDAEAKRGAKRKAQ